MITPKAESANRTGYLNSDSKEEDNDFSQAARTAIPIGETEQEAATIEAIAARIPRLRDHDNPSRLTPLRAHYLKKTLVKLEMEKEIQLLSRQDALSLLGPPFKPSKQTQQVSLPLLRFLFHHFVLTFPFLRSAPPNFFADKVQVFVDRFAERNISSTDDRDETTKRKKLGGRMSKWFVLLMSAAIHVKGGDGAEEILKIADHDRNRLFAAHDRRYKNKNGILDGGEESGTFDVNVIGVRTKKQKVGRLQRGKAHDEFIIRTRQPGGKETFVSRRYGDFARLADTLRLEFPEEEIPRPPPKDRRETDVKSPVHTAESSLNDSATDDIPQIGSLNLNPTSPSPSDRLTSRDKLLPPSPSPNSVDSAIHSARSSTSADSGTRSIMPGPLARERNRLTLRAYLRSLLKNPHVAESEALVSFLLSEPTTLTSNEESDMLAREALDAVRDDEAKRFTDEANRRVAELRHHLQSFKEDLIQEDGLTRIFGTIKSTPNVEDLPEKYRALLAWGRISLASTLFHMFVGGDASSDLFNQLKRIHGLMPYFMLRGILRVSNPVSMIRGVLDLFLAQPFGQRSLAQRMLTSNIQEEVRELSEMASRIALKVEDDVLCERIRCFVCAPYDLQMEMRQEAEKDRLDIITVILKSDTLPGASADVPPPLPLTRNQIHRVVRSSRAYERYKEYRKNLGKNDVDEGPDAIDDDAWLYEDLHVLLKCLTRLRDKEQLVSLLFEGVTSELLKDIVTIFYSPLAQVYKAANIADSLSDLQAFINDLIRTVEGNEDLSYTDPQKTVQVFIDLVSRHEGRFYSFVHQVHSKGSGLFDGLMHWVELFINFIRGPEDGAPSTGGAVAKRKRHGVGEVDLEICLPAGGQERKRVLHEIDCVVVHAYRLKLIRELKLKGRLADREVRGAAKVAGSSDGQGGFGITDDMDEDAFMGALAENFGVGDAFADEVNEVEAEEEAEEEDERENEENDEDDDDDEHFYESSMDENSSHENSPSFKPVSERKPNWVPPKPQRSVSTLTAKAADKDLPPIPIDNQAKAKRRRRTPKAPQLELIPEMLPLFIEMVRPLLRPARTASASSIASPISAAAMQNAMPTVEDEERAPSARVPGGWFS